MLALLLQPPTEAVGQVERIARNTERNDLPRSIASVLLPLSEAGDEYRDFLGNIPFAENIGQLGAFNQPPGKRTNRFDALGAEAAVKLQPSDKA